jgi:transcription elongation factor GreB
MAEENDLSFDDENDPDEDSGISGSNTKNYITPGGAERLKAELRRLRDVERPKLVETVAWAASNGDRSENADYIYGKRRLREIDRRVRFLMKRLEIAEVIDPGRQSSDRVLFGATVTVEDQNGDERVYTIVGADETDATRGWVSWISPIGRGLLQAKVDDVVIIPTPKIELELTVVKIEYKSLESK